MRPAVPDPPEVHHRLWTGFTGLVGWDVGANCGQTLAEMRQRFHTVIAFEPARECWPYLSDLPDVTFLPLAISDVDDTVHLVEIPTKIDTGQLVTGDITGMEWASELGDARIRAVPCRRVDTLVNTLPPPDFMKIDVEGHELKVLFGARKTLAIRRPDLLIEFHAKDLHRSCVDLLEHMGYTCQTLRHPHYTPGTDMWFTHGWIKAKIGTSPFG